MLKLVKSRHEYLSPSVLFLDDIERIIEIISKVSDEIKITTNEYELESVKELSELNKQYITELHIDSHKPSISLDLESQDIRLYLGEVTPEARGILEEIKDVLCSRRRKFWSLFSRKGFITWIIFSGVSFFLPEGRIWDSALIFLFIPLFTFWIWWSWKVVFHEYSLIFLKESRQESWWKRNKDKIIVGVIVGVVISIVQALVWIFLRK